MEMYKQLEFSPKAANILVKEQGLNSPDRLHVLTDKNVYDICNVFKMSGTMNANGTPTEGIQCQMWCKKIW